MFSRLREHLGTAGLVVAIVALIAALAGGAIAANNSGGGKATASAKAKKGPRGPKGAKGDTGAAGAAGPAGAPGAAGPQGSAGEDGEKGKSGTNGTNGTSGVDGEDGPTGPTGSTGVTGPQGEPWTNLDVLPPGETETGAWSFGPLAAGLGLGQAIQIPISFTLPLAADLGLSNVHYLNAANLEVTLVGGNPTTNPSTACLGTAADPKAAPGHLCVYTGEEQGAFLIYNESFGNPSASGLPGASKAGSVIVLVSAEQGAKAMGTWAVTAPAAP